MFKKIATWFNDQGDFPSPYQAFDAGMRAAIEGREFWENPYADPKGSKIHCDHWFAGWCYGKKRA